MDSTVSDGSEPQCETIRFKKGRLTSGGPALPSLAFGPPIWGSKQRISAGRI